MDEACETRKIAIDESWFAKRESSLKFSELGGLVGVTVESSSAAAGIADTLVSLPGTVSGALENAQKIRSTWATLRDSGLDEELARTKKEVELKQQQLSAAGLAATESQSAELERLKQQAEILGQQKLIGDAALDPGAREISRLKQQIDQLKNQKDISVSTRELQAEHELYTVRLEVERLQADKAQRDNTPPPG
jgi:chromosome segregation ATPase